MYTGKKGKQAYDDANEGVPYVRLPMVKEIATDYAQYTRHAIGVPMSFDAWWKLNHKRFGVKFE